MGHLYPLLGHGRFDTNQRASRQSRRRISGGIITTAAAKEVSKAKPQIIMAY
jgi:hypothetical protein